MSDIRKRLLDAYPGSDQDLVFLEPEYFDEAVIGVAQSQTGLFAVCYSEPKVLEILVEHDGMSQDEAMEYYQFNIMGAYVGENTPVFVDDELLYAY
jgi:hypothetical protein